MSVLETPIYGSEGLDSNSNFGNSSSGRVKAKKDPLFSQESMKSDIEPQIAKKKASKEGKALGKRANEAQEHSTQLSGGSGVSPRSPHSETHKTQNPEGNLMGILQQNQTKDCPVHSPRKVAESPRRRSRKSKRIKLAVQSTASTSVNSQHTVVNPESYSLIGCRIDRLVPTLVTEDMKRVAALSVPKTCRSPSPEYGSPMFSSPSKMSVSSQLNNYCHAGSSMRAGVGSPKNQSRIGGISTSNSELIGVQPTYGIAMTTTSLMCEEISGLSESEKETFESKPKYLVGATSSGNYNCDETSYNSCQLIESGISQGFVVDIPLLCVQHRSEHIKFICCFPGCNMELCGNCLLGHRVHIHHIKAITDLLNIAIQTLDDTPNKEADAERHEVAKKLENLDIVQSEILGFFKEKFGKIRKEITAENRYLGDQSMMRELLKHQMKKPPELRSVVSNAMLAKLKGYLKHQSNPRGCTLLADVELVKTKLQEIFDDHLRLVRSGRSFETTDIGKPKYLHWVEWGKKKLFIYDAIKNHTRPFDLDVNFKMPAFSRTVVIPTGELYLLGGEEPELTVRDEVYCIDIPEAIMSNQSPKITTKARMPRNKYDFTCCHLDGHIYVISGKDRISEVVADCERYNIEENRWEIIANVKNPRFAASSCAIEGTTKIYLFGGRTEGGNDMVHSIEQYCSAQNVWRILELKNPTIWVPVEICGIAQIDEIRMLVFGGSDVKVRDTASSYIFNSAENSITKIADLRKPQVFVSPSLVFGAKVYAFGNEYYAKHKTLHRFSIDLMAWEFIM